MYISSTIVKNDRDLEHLHKLSSELCYCLHAQRIWMLQMCKQAWNILRLLNSHPLDVPYWLNRLRIIRHFNLYIFHVGWGGDRESPLYVNTKKKCISSCFRFYWHWITYFYWIVCGFYMDSTFACKYSYCDWILITLTYNRRCSIIGSLCEGKKIQMVISGVSRNDNA